MDAVDYIRNIVDEILARRRSHSERRNDFMQIMVDREEEVEDEEKTKQPIKESRGPVAVLKKSMPVPNASIKNDRVPRLS